MIFYNNYAPAGGGVMADHGNPVIDSCLFIDNMAGYGGLFAEAMVAAAIVYCTFSDNGSPEGGVIDFRLGYLTVQNTIITFSDQSGTVSFRGNNNISISYLDFCGNTGGDWFCPIADQLGVNGNVCLNPLFVDLTDGDCRLNGASPCIDAGDPLSPYDPDSAIADMGVFMTLF